LSGVETTNQKLKNMKKQILTTALLVFMFVGCTAQTTIKLPEPQKTGGMPLMEALNNRKTQRNFSERELSQQQLSNLLWAATGVNREDGRMTAPTASNHQQMVIFVALKNGVYQYFPQTHELKLHLAGDHRLVFARQQPTFNAPVLLAFVSDWDKMTRYDNDETKKKYSKTDAGNISQNVYLYCASEGMATVAIGNFDAELFSKTLKLGSNYYPVINQAVRFPQ